MARDPRYQRLLNSKRWKELRAWKLAQTQGYCEICYREGWRGIDALAVGVTFAFLSVKIVPAVSFIGAITFTLSMVGVKIGNVFGSRFEKKAQFFGGAILMLLGLKILLEHLGILA